MLCSPSLREKKKRKGKNLRHELRLLKKSQKKRIFEMSMAKGIGAGRLPKGVDESSGERKPPCWPEHKVTGQLVEGFKPSGIFIVKRRDQ